MNTIANTNNIIRKEKLFSGLDITLPILLHKPSDKDLEDYAISVRSRIDINYSLNFFLDEKYNPEKTHILIADLSYMEISSTQNEEPLNLKCANFRGAYFYKTRFENCDLENSIFADSVLTDVYFRYSNLNNADFRGCNLETCHFGHEYLDDPLRQMKGFKVSLSSSELRIFADIKNDIARKNEHQRLLDDKRLELREIINKTGFFKKLSFHLGLSDENCNYKQIMEEIQGMESGIFQKEYIVHQSIKNIFENESCSFYPVYERARKDMRIVKHKKYVKLTREDIEQFVATTDKIINASLNEFAREKYIAEQGDGYEMPQDTFIIADLSSKVNKFGNNEWNRTNLSGFSFAGRDMSYVNFAGTDLSKCNFSGSNLSGSNLNCCKLIDSIFSSVDLSDCNLINTDISNSIFENSNLTRANLSWSRAKGIKIIGSNLSYAIIKKSDCFRGIIENSKFEGTNIEKSDLSKSKISKCSFTNAVLNKIKLDDALVFNSELINTLVNNSSLLNSSWNQVKFENIEATKSNLTGIKFSSDSEINKANFYNSILDGFKAPFCKITNSNFDKTKIGYGKFAGAEFNGSTFRFAELNCTVMSDCKLEGGDFTGATIYNTGLMRSNLIDSIFLGAKIRYSDLTGANFENSNWFSLLIKASVIQNINNDKIKINDSTEFMLCIIKGMEKQFYYYDEEDFMNIISVEQHRTNQAKIHTILKMRKYGAFSFLLKLFSNEYAIPQKTVLSLLKARKKNRHDLKARYHEIREMPNYQISEAKLKIKNLILSHNI